MNGRSSIFSEIRQAQRLRRLLVSLISQRGNDQHDDGDHIGQHLIELLDGQIHAGGDIHVKNVKAAEQERGENTDIGTPYGEDNKGNGKPASVAEGVVCQMPLA